MDVIEQATAVAMVLLLLGSMLWWLRRRGIAVIGLPVGGRSRKMQCMERLPLGPHHALHLIHLGDTDLLVASAPGGCSLLHRRPHSNSEEVR
jgi:flagellar biogenesis protein FliO